MLKRKIEETLLAWKQEDNHKPIVIKGCRQCSKLRMEIPRVQRLFLPIQINIMYIRPLN